MIAWMFVIMAANELFILVNGAAMFRLWIKTTGEFLESQNPSWNYYEEKGIDPIYTAVLSIHGWLWLFALLVSIGMFLFLTPHKILPLALMVTLLVLNHTRGKNADVFVTDSRFMVEHILGSVFFILAAL